MISIETINGRLKLTLNDDTLCIEGAVGDVIYNGDNLLTFLFYFINDDTMAKLLPFRESNEVKLLLGKLKSIRKDIKECTNCIKKIYFEGYRECSHDIQSLYSSNAEKYLKIDVDNYILVEKTIDMYIEDNIDYMMSLYQTVHDQMLMKFDFMKDFCIVLEDDKVELWEDYDSNIKVNWEKLEKYTSDKFQSGELSIYSIRKVRKDISKHKNITTNQLTYFAPLKEVYERNYYQIKGGTDTYE